MKKERHHRQSFTEPNWPAIEHLPRNILNYICVPDNSHFNREHNSILSRPRQELLFPGHEGDGKSDDLPMTVPAAAGKTPAAPAGESSSSRTRIGLACFLLDIITAQVTGTVRGALNWQPHSCYQLLRSVRLVRTVSSASRCLLTQRRVEEGA